jgi:hypothetical protein
MPEMISVFFDRPLASAFGLAGLLFTMIWPLFHSRQAILAAQLGIGLGYLFHYALLEAWTGASITALGATQTALSFFIAGHPLLRQAMLGFLPLVAGITWLTWIGLPSLFAGMALTLIMLGRLQLDEIRMRLFLLAAAPFGMAYDFAVGSLPAFAGGAVATVIGIAMLAHELRARKPAVRSLHAVPASG